MMNEKTKKKLKYFKPQVIVISSQLDVYGACNTGPGANDGCGGGSSATPACNPGTTPTGGCSNGAQAYIGEGQSGCTGGIQAGWANCNAGPSVGAQGCAGGFEVYGCLSGTGVGFACTTGSGP